MTIETKIEELRAAIDAAQATLSAAEQERDQAAAADDDTHTDTDTGKVRLSAAEEGRLEARRRTALRAAGERPDNASGEAQGDAAAQQMSGTGAAAGVAEAQRRAALRKSA